MTRWWELRENTLCFILPASVWKVCNLPVAERPKPETAIFLYGNLTVSEITISNSHEIPTTLLPFGFTEHSRILRKLSAPTFDAWRLVFAPDATRPVTREQQQREHIRLFRMRCVEAVMLRHMEAQYASMEFYILPSDEQVNKNPNTPRYDYVAWHFIMEAIRTDPIIRMYWAKNKVLFSACKKRYQDQYRNHPNAPVWR